MALQKGASVKIKSGVKINDLSFSIEGWHGRIGKSEHADMILIELDSIVLANLSEDYIIETLRMTDIDSFNHFYLNKDDVEPAEARDTLNDVAIKLEEINDKYYWKAMSDGSPEEDLLAQVIKGTKTTEEELYAWEEYLHKELTFPIKVEVAEADYNSSMRTGTTFKLTQIMDADDKYGIIVNGKKILKPVYSPLCNLEVIDKKDPNYLPIRAYVIWFANR
jgi:hypothetical protein